MTCLMKGRGYICTRAFLLQLLFDPSEIFLFVKRRTESPSIRIYQYFYWNLTTNTDEILKILNFGWLSSHTVLYMELTVKYWKYIQNPEKWGCVVLNWRNCKNNTWETSTYSYRPLFWLTTQDLNINFVFYHGLLTTC